MVSIVIPVYNGEKYIERCLGSLLSENQEGIEVIAINDGSKDSSLSLLESFAKRYSNLRVIDKENGGAAQARLRGMQEAKGEYIGFLDVDDWADPDMYTEMEKKAMASGADIVFCNYVEESSSGSHVVKNQFQNGQSFPMKGEETMWYLHSRKAFFPFPWNKIYRADLIRSVEFPKGNFVGEDYNMQLQLLGMTDRIDYVDFDGYHYVLTEGSASRSGYGESTVRAYEHYKEDYQMVVAKYPHMKRHVANYLMIEYMACIIAMGRNDTYNHDMIKEIKKFVRRGLFGFLCAGYVSFKMKGSAVALCISYRLLIKIYRMMSA